MGMVEVYRETQITITTVKSGKKVWTSRAEFYVPGQGDVQVEPADAAYQSEEEARQAALQAAVESIDRSRISIGKW